MEEEGVRVGTEGVNTEKRIFKNLQKIPTNRKKINNFFSTFLPVSRRFSVTHTTNKYNQHAPTFFKRSEEWP